MTSPTLIDRQRKLAATMPAERWTLLCHYSAFMDALYDQIDLAEKMAEEFHENDRTPDELLKLIEANSP